ncbi:hypothetical protein IC006_2401 [Sulfuracidifex tepidarius]|uniref:Uncharacterized protein n=1 Tax=Sulfuracidifex tepidarius TaxID=1294262 RepID=A0A510E712_9CREN|nr:hypothetical protein IC006_2401 [Sulfuracidifex tepidarius]BBG27848.1 hypothetical protein IC007_2403 [Sulfuracidifex tepidarius]
MKAFRNLIGRIRRELPEKVLLLNQAWGRVRSPGPKTVIIHTSSDLKGRSVYVGP